MFIFSDLQTTLCKLTGGRPNSHSRANRKSAFRSGASWMASLAALLLISPTAMGGVEAANTDKVNFQIFEIDSPLSDILWCGNTNDVILVQSQAGTIYRSRDRGDTWKKLHSIMTQTGMSVVDEGQSVSQYSHLYRSSTLRAQ